MGVGHYFWNWLHLWSAVIDLFASSVLMEPAEDSCIDPELGLDSVDPGIGLDNSLEAEEWDPEH